MEKDTKTHRTREALPAPLPAQRLNRLHPIPDTLLAFLTLRHAQPHMARFAVGMALVHREADIVFRTFGEFTVTRERA